MLFTRSKIFMACAMSTTLLLGACSNDKNNQGNTNTLTATAPATGEASNLSERNAQQRLIKTLQQHFKKANINAKVVDVKATEVPNLYWVSLEGMPSVYATSDGKYLIQGDMIRLGDKELHSVSENLQSVENKRYLQELKTEDLIVYPAKNKTQHIIYVFTDVSCPYCQKLHAHMDEITAKGIEVRYIAWPRGDQLFPAMESIWCSKDRAAAFEQAIQGVQLPAATCKTPVRAQYELGHRMGVNGTPAIYNSEGEYLGGYLAPDELLKRLNN
ncbi:DsbC family protein [Acinetobacter radioresistens]|jgi:thiol:disulfide interchange protein DsbC|uniref:DsbC family protein n=1 Tax=Acinetobacter radioresistens TaxID=40216 RepID=UPI002003E649|nr:DsbC family protein [Acinetobacter radioresistens]MCK4087639.1 DsbC family protein [Acinetobacter radioresistens]MCK4108751.1 DsbC family protein [Acinetobacter radioresistens]MCX0331130.1 DsbC family protein [Acinetobacter radioresistens]